MTKAASRSLLSLVVGFAMITSKAEVAHGREGSACDAESAHICTAGKLPRVTSHEWTVAEVQSFMTSAAIGTVAIAVDKKTRAARLVTSCRLPGSYTEARTKPGQGRLWATNRVVLLPGEVDRAACVSATHLVAAFARASNGAVTFSAILVPLPCPSVTEEAPASGCIAEGQSGPDRLSFARGAIGKLRKERARTGVVSVEDYLQVYALAPDHPDTLGFLYWAPVDAECAVHAQVEWAGRQYRTTRDPSGQQIATLRPADDIERTIEKPTLDVNAGVRSCLHHPAFRKCFAGIAEPVDDPWRCWEPVIPSAPASAVAAPARSATPVPPTAPKSPAGVTKP